MAAGAGPGLADFSEATRSWFTSAFAEPTPAQAQAWTAIGNGDHTLVIAPTGSGKTLAAFLWAIDKLATEPVPADPKRRCRVLYISPLKALATDVQRNLRSPLTGVTHAARRLGLPEPDITVAVRTGDTAADERRKLASKPPDILITTPESLFLMLTSQARDGLRGVETVIVDEVHALAGGKRGAHLALSLERLDALRTVEGAAAAGAARPAQRIGLSATVRPPEEVAAFLGGALPVTIVAPPSQKRLDLQIVVPVEDMADLQGADEVFAAGVPMADGRVVRPAGPGGKPRAGSELLPDSGDPVRKHSIWPHVEERVLDLIQSHRSTIVFANSRRLAERLCARLNDLAAERAAESADQPTAFGDNYTRPPAELMGQAGATAGAPGIVARAHHGSVSRQERSQIEEALKAGTLPAVVATSSLELGIDMGEVDLVIQVESPPSVASGLQRTGRAGHHVGDESRGIFFPKYQGDLVQTAVVTQRMHAGQIEEVRMPRNPLDVLAQQIVAMTAMDDWEIGELEQVVRRAAPFSGLTRPVLTAVLDMLSGRYPSEDFAGLRPRLVWDRTTGTLTGRPAASGWPSATPARSRTAGCSACSWPAGRLTGPAGTPAGLASSTRRWSTSPESATSSCSARRPGGSRTSPPTRCSSRPRRASQAGCRSGKAMLRVVRPSWVQRSARSCRELGSVSEQLRRSPGSAAADLDELAAANLVSYLHQQREATGYLPDDRTLVLERFRDELGDWRLVLHSPYGAQLHAPWALAIAARLRDRYGGMDVQAQHTDDGIVIRVPDADDPPPAGIAMLDPDEVAQVVTAEVGTSALFASRFRECAARALLLPRRQPGRRTPLWQQRQRSAQLLAVASQYSTFPIALETMRECLQDVFDVPGLTALMRDIAARARPAGRGRDADRIAVQQVAAVPVCGRVHVRRRRAARRATRSGARARLGSASRAARPGRAARAARPARRRGDRARAAAARARPGLPGRRGRRRHAARARPADAPPKSAERRPTRRRRRPGWPASPRSGACSSCASPGRQRWSAIEDAGRLRDALGVALPPGVPDAFTEPVPDPLRDLVLRYARTHGPFGAAGSSRSDTGSGSPSWPEPCTGWPPKACCPRATSSRAAGIQWCEVGVLRMLRRRCLAKLRKEVEPAPPSAYAAFLPAWQHADRAGPRSSGASQRVRPAAAGQGRRRLRRDRPAGRSSDPGIRAGNARAAGPGTRLLPGAAGRADRGRRDCLGRRRCAAGSDGWIVLAPAAAAPLLLPEPADITTTPVHQAVLGALEGGGALFFRSIADRIPAALAVQEGKARRASATAMSRARSGTWSGPDG